MSVMNPDVVGVWQRSLSLDAMLRAMSSGMASPLALWLSQEKNFRTSYVSFARGSGFSILKPAYDKGLVPPPQFMAQTSDTPKHRCCVRTLPHPSAGYEWSFSFWMLDEMVTRRGALGTVGDQWAPTMMMADLPVQLRAVFVETGEGPPTTPGWTVSAVKEGFDELGHEFIRAIEHDFANNDLSRGFIATADAGNPKTNGVEAMSFVPSQYVFDHFRFDRWMILAGSPGTIPSSGDPGLHLDAGTSGIAVAVYATVAGPPDIDVPVSDPESWRGIWGPYRRELRTASAMAALESQVAALQGRLDALSRKRGT